MTSRRLVRKFSLRSELRNHTPPDHNPGYIEKFTEYALLTNKQNCFKVNHMGCIALSSEDKDSERVKSLIEQIKQEAEKVTIADRVSDPSYQPYAPLVCVTIDRLQTFVGHWKRKLGGASMLIDPSLHSPWRMVFDSGVVTLQVSFCDVDYVRVDFSVVSTGTKVWMALVKDFIESFRDPEPKKDRIDKDLRRKVGILSMTERGVDITPMGVVSMPFERDNYEASVNEAFDFMREDVCSAVPYGRLSIIEGPPGTGKSFFIRGLVEAVVGVAFIYVPPGMLSALTHPGLVNVLLRLKEEKSRPIVFILEDAEEALSSRMADNISQINALLNMCDGFFGEMLDIRVVATTNVKKVELDEAIKRDGRLGTHLYIGHPSRDLADKILRRLTGKNDVSMPMHEKDSVSLASVYTHARKLGWKPPNLNEDESQSYGSPEGSWSAGRGEAGIGFAPGGSGSRSFRVLAH